MGSLSRPIVVWIGCICVFFCVFGRAERTQTTSSADVEALERLFSFLDSEDRIRGEALLDPGSRYGEYAAPQGAWEAQETASIVLEQIFGEAERTGIDLQDYGVVFLHEGERIPPEIRWLITHLAVHGIQCQVIRKRSRASEDSSKAELIRDIEAGDAETELLWRLRHEMSQSPEVEALFQSEEAREIRRFTVRNFFSNLRAFFGERGQRRFILLPKAPPTLGQRFKAKLKGFFGLHSGVQVGMFSDSKTGLRQPFRNHVNDWTMASLSAGIVTGLSYLVLEGANFGSELPEVRMKLGLCATFLSQLFFGLLERPLSSFQTQGKALRWDGRHEIDTNLKWFWMTSIGRSSVANLGLQAAFFGWQVLATPAAWSVSALNTLLGLFGKGAFKLKIAKNQQQGTTLSDSSSRQHTPQKTNQQNALFRVGWQTLKVGDLLGKGVVDVLYWVAAFIGGTMEGYQHLFGTRDPDEKRGRQALKQLQKDARRWSAQLGFRREEQVCTSILLRKLTQEQQELLDLKRSGDLRNGNASLLREQGLL